MAATCKFLVIAQLAMFGKGSKPEAFVPLPDGRAIPVKMQGQQQGRANIQIVNNATGLAAIEAREDALAGKILLTVNAAVDQKMRAQVPAILADYNRRSQ